MANVLEIILSGNTKELDASLSKTEKRLNDFGKKMQSIGKDMSLYLTAPIVALGGASIKLASSFNESLNKVDVAFKESSQQVKDFAKTTLTTFGIAEGSALDMAALFGDMSTSMGLTTSQAAKLSTSLVGLAGDLASFKDMNVEEVTTALNGVFTGETESLKRLGIVMTEVNLKQFALDRGMNANLQTMSQAEKVMLRYNYIMAMTTNAQGDFARTGDSAANQTRQFTQGLKQLGQQFGEILLPTFTKIVNILNQLIKYFSELGAGTKTLIVALSGFVALSGPLLYMAGTILPKLIDGYKLLNVQIKLLGTNIKAIPLVTLITLLGLAGKSAYDYISATSVKTEFSAEETKNAEALQKTIDGIDEQIKKLESLKETQVKSTQVTTGFNTMTDQFNGTNKKLISTLKEKKQKAEALLQIQNLQNKATEEGVKVEEDNGIVHKFTAEQLAKEADEVKKLVDAYAKLQRQQSEQIREQISNEFKLANAITKPEGRMKGLDGASSGNLQKARAERKKIADSLISTINPLSIVDTMTASIAENITGEQQEIIDGWITTGEKMAKIQSDLQPILGGMSQLFNQMGQSIVNSLGEANTAFGAFIRGFSGFVINYLSEAIKKIKIDEMVAKSGVIGSIFKGLSKLGPAGLVLAAGALAGGIAMVNKAFSGVKKFADGGIVSGPTMAMVGEYSGAKRNPEVIAPLDRLQSMIGGAGGNVNVTGEFVVRGQDLVLALQRADQFKNRIS